MVVEREFTNGIFNNNIETETITMMKLFSKRERLIFAIYVNVHIRTLILDDKWKIPALPEEEFKNECSGTEYILQVINWRKVSMI